MTEVADLVKVAGGRDQDVKVAVDLELVSLD